MNHLQPAPAPLHGDESLDAAVTDKLLSLLAIQSGRVPVAVFAILAVMAAIAAPRASPWISGVWLALAVVVLVVRRQQLSTLPNRADLTRQSRLKIAIRLSFLNGLVHGSSLFVFPYLTEIERAFFSVLLMGMCTGAVSTTGGHRRLFIAYLIPSVGALPLLWLWSPGILNPTWVERSIGLLLVLNIWLLVGLARDAWKTLVESVEIRFKEHNLNAQLQAALAQATHSNEAKTRFLAAASHDLRQPLHTLTLLTATLSMRSFSGRDREIIDLLSQVTGSLSDQLDTLLDISKLDAGIVPINLAPLSLSDLLQRQFAESRGIIEKKGLKASLDCAPDLVVNTDANLITRVVRNLIDNAVKFTTHGAVTLQLGAQSGNAILVIEDTGCGIAPENHNKVFEEFYQIGNIERNHTQGLGLGLSIVSRLTRLLDIKLSMASAFGKGTRFELVLPLIQGEAILPTPLHTFLGDFDRSFHVLVIDDDPRVRTSMRLLIEEIGCTSSMASDTEEAVQAARTRHPDIVISDLRLHGTDTGINAVMTVRDYIGHVPALLVSGDTAPDRLREANQAGFRLLHKPLSAGILFSEMQAAINAK